MAVYGEWVEDVLSSWLTGKSFKAMLVDASYVQSDSDEFRTDITSYEVSGTGYSAGGIAATVTLGSVDTSAHTVALDVDDLAFGSIDVTNLGGVALYVDTGSASTDRLIAVDMFGDMGTPGPVDYTYIEGDGGFVIASFDVDV